MNTSGNKKYNLVAENPQSTVVAEYTPVYRAAKTYQSEAELERAFIEQLQSQAYEYLPIRSEADLILNLRQQLEKLNNFTFTDTEWERFFTGEIANPNQSIAEKTATIQEDYIKNLKRDDGTVKNIYLLRKDKIHENSLQVINQYATTPSPEGATPPKEGNLSSPDGATPPKEGNITALTDSSPDEGNLCASLPAELNARRKQYEYYRNKLLTFKEFNSPPPEGCQSKTDGVVS